jgi:hypothetical protein
MHQRGAHGTNGFCACLLQKLVEPPKALEVITVCLLATACHRLELVPRETERYSSETGEPRGLKRHQKRRATRCEQDWYPELARASGADGRGVGLT